MTTTPSPPPADSSAESPVDPTNERPHDGPHDGPRVTGAEVRDLSRLRRSTTDRKVAGVAGGLARHLDIDPLILRVGFVVLAFFGGAGLILYAAIWALVPEDDTDRATVHLDERSRTVALVALGVIAALALVGDSWGAFWFPWPLAIIGVIAFVWLSRSGRDTASEPAEWEGADPAGPAGPAGYGPAPAYAAPRPRDPRKRGPILFWFTLLLIAVAEGVLGIVDLWGAPVVDSAYAAVAVGVIATMLVVGSVVGRAGGLIALGLLTSLGLIGATAADRWDGDRLFVAPTSASDVASSYSLSTGELVVDLSDVTDPEELDGRTLDVSGDAGRIEVVVPEGVDVQVEADVDGPGGYDLFGRQGGGIDWTQTATHDGGTDAPSMTIDATLGVGEITVRTD
jgi:phage shock protein PspC (stress-responsive transcriptional regulator)